MDSTGENRVVALECAEAWKAVGARLSLELFGPSDLKFTLSVRVLNINDSAEDSLLAFAWSTDTADCLPNRSFAHSEGTLVISLEDAAFAISDNPKTVTISRGPY